MAYKDPHRDNSSKLANACGKWIRPYVTCLESIKRYHPELTAEALTRIAAGWVFDRLNEKDKRNAHRDLILEAARANLPAIVAVKSRESIARSGEGADGSISRADVKDLIESWLGRECDDPDELDELAEWSLDRYLADGLADAEALGPIIVERLSAEAEQRLYRRWLACVPLPLEFARFPQYTEFGEFQILNPGSVEEGCERVDKDESGPAFDRLRDLLSEHYDVAFLDFDFDGQVWPFEKLQGHVVEKSSGFIPHRPLLIFHCSSGLEGNAVREARAVASKIMPLLRICQLVLECGDDRDLSGFTRLPDIDSLLDDREPRWRAGDSRGATRVELPNLLLMLDARSGGVADDGLHKYAIVPREVIYDENIATPVGGSDYAAVEKELEQFFENEWARLGRGVEVRNQQYFYDVNRFAAVWERLASPILSLHGDRKRSNAIDRCINAVAQVSQCLRYPERDLIFSCVSGIEAMFGYKGDLSERFALSVAVLTTVDPLERHKAYSFAKSVYSARSKHAHQAMPTRVDAWGRATRTDTLAVFCDVLEAYVAWLAGLDLEKNPVSDFVQAFSDRVVDRVFSGSPWLNQEAGLGRDIFKHLVVRTANVAIGPSTLRNQGDAGVVKAARNALKLLPLQEYGVLGESDFGEMLDSHTQFVLQRLPENARNWGAARKSLNIFLRDVLYSRYLCREYGLAKLESLLEVPLDRDIATRLLAEPEGVDLPKWGTIKRLTPGTSEQYQSVARRVAKRLGTHPVHLDVLYWGRSQA